MPRVTERILELNNKCTQVLMFLSFAIAASALLSEKNLSFLPAMRCWAWAIFPILFGILPLQDFSPESELWLSLIRWLKVLVLWTSTVVIFIGAVYFVRAF
jgi:hypothetical protein